MDVLIILAALALLIVVAYRGFSVILFAPVAALLAAALTSPTLVFPFYSGIFMERLASFVKLYFPVFLLGAVFGKLMEVSGFARALLQALIGLIGARHAMLAIVGVAAMLTYGGVSLFVVVFAVYPFAAEMFRVADIPKRLIPATLVLGLGTFTMDALPGSPQIQNIIPTAFFHTNAWAAPWLGLFGGTLVFASGMAYLEWRRRQAAKTGEGYGEGHRNEPHVVSDGALPNPWLAVAPLLIVGVLNKLNTSWIPAVYGKTFDFAAVGVAKTGPVDIGQVAALWSVEAALAILFVAVTAWGRLRARFHQETQQAVGGAMLATLNTGSEYGFGAVIASLAGFQTVNAFLSQAISQPLVNAAVTTTTLAGITGSASGGMSIALASMGQTYLERAQAAGIPAEVLHRVTAMASGGMDSLPHNGAIITLLAVTGMTHRESYRDIFAITCLKTAMVFLVIAFYSLFGVY
ncbi:MAG: GntP family permease [Acidobacteria bacterium]|nr:GntP family permease [Acidobacteriota bacterium]